MLLLVSDADLLHFADRLKIRLLDLIPQVVGAILTILIGFWIANRIGGLIRRIFRKRSLDPSLGTFLSSLATIGLKVLILITAAGMVGFQTTSLVAILGAAGLAVGLALQGSLSNFAGGVLALVLKPYRIGDLITSQGEFGEVKEIGIFCTILVTADQKTIILPNGAVMNNMIINHSKMGMLRVSLDITVDFNEQIGQVRQHILEALAPIEIILKTPAPSVHVMKIGDATAQLSVQFYAAPGQYWTTYFAAMEAIHDRFVSSGIKSPDVLRYLLNRPS